MSLEDEITPPLGARHRDSGGLSMVWQALFQTSEKIVLGPLQLHLYANLQSSK